MADTSSGTDFAEMSDIMETEDEKEHALHCDQYNENPTGGEDDFEVDAGDEYAEKEEEEGFVCALPSAAVSTSTAEAMPLAARAAHIGVSKPAAASAVELTEEQKERIARNKQLAMQRLAGREAAKAAENAAAEDSSGASTDGRSHMSRYIASTNPFHHVTDHESSGLLASHQTIKKQRLSLPLTVCTDP